jgi:signal transduction histidine kinase
MVDAIVPVGHSEVTITGLAEGRRMEAHLTQVLQNLFRNAINYGGKVIRISAESEGSFVVFSIADGIGIDPQYHEQIFGLFKRLDRNYHPDVSGLGLAICRRVVERYGG